VKPFLFAGLALGAIFLLLPFSPRRVTRVTNESGAVRDIVEIHIAETQFLRDNGRIGMLEELDLRRHFREGPYQFELNAEGTHYVIRAWPKKFGRDGRRSFYSDETTEVRYEWGYGRVAGPQSPVLGESSPRK
jgi:hypothetical protein